MVNYYRSILVLSVILVLGIAAFTAGCSTGNAPVTPAPTTPAATNPATATPAITIPGAVTTVPATSGAAVTIENFAFDPSALTVKAGTTVTWTNRDSAPHTVTSDTGAFGSGTLANGGTFSFTFSQAGTFAFHCSIHPSMKGTIIVQP